MQARDRHYLIERDGLVLNLIMLRDPAFSAALAVCVCG
jgi:hypothetical protein